MVVTYIALKPQESAQPFLQNQAASFLGQHPSSADCTPSPWATGPSVCASTSIWDRPAPHGRAQLSKSNQPWPWEYGQLANSPLHRTWQLGVDLTTPAKSLHLDRYMAQGLQKWPEQRTWPRLSHSMHHSMRAASSQPLVHRHGALVLYQFS